ncbi:SDR family NAD(P)-dependent oxidoreductase [Candidatus Mycosynbacter amalyticus]|uniref:SDR family NAD(P)-dependent oxidoreductase n=1 Tax=Candidatus Mycosynbacter amalyticus TaxID=2665156 RepID=A0A857MME6_9BACT|nr:SDR family NAD(P)-dependent oxidoreductase [Candidatus Mycosynbacter amalyticus]QHN42995.1 SDR family NAD(P)-dependent oxidoreductase [Candidatus Mycosynbacter amalyticus]
MGFFSRDKSEEPKQETTTTESGTPAQLSADSTIREWLDHPVGGTIFRSMLAEAGQNEKVLTPVKGWTLKRVAGMSGGKMTDEMIADMVQKANAGEATAAPTETQVESTEAPSAEEAPAAPAPETPVASTASSEPDEWVEKITDGRFANKTIIVTGAGSGIGRATASRIAREGGRVIGVDISQERLDELKASLAGAQIEVVAGDITNDESVAKIVEVAGTRIDGLANIAGIMDNMTPVHEVDDATWNRVMNVNVVGTMKLMRAIVPKMLEQKAGSIVNITSEAGLRGSAAGAAYTASKHAVIGLTKSSAFAYTGTGIRVNAVAPGGVATNIEAKFDSPMFLDRFGVASAVMPAPTTADQLAASITFLLSDDGTNVNGAILPSDGGWSAV